MSLHLSLSQVWSCNCDTSARVVFVTAVVESTVVVVTVQLVGSSSPHQLRCVVGEVCTSILNVVCFVEFDVNVKFVLGFCDCSFSLFLWPSLFILFSSIAQLEKLDVG